MVVGSPSATQSGETGRQTTGNDKPCMTSKKHQFILPKFDSSTRFAMHTAARKASKSVQTQTLSPVHSMQTQTPRHRGSEDQGCDSFTQTPLPSESHQFQFSSRDRENLQSGFTQASVGTQVAMLASHCDFGVGTDDSLLLQLGCFDGSATMRPFGISANMSPQRIPVQQLPPLSSFVQRTDQANMVSTIDNSMQTLASDQAHTSLIDTSDIRPLSSTQTQTNNLELVPHEDNETQTLVSLLGMDSVSSMDSGTQTQNFLDDLFDAQDIELTESQTQTWFPSYRVTSPSLDNGVNDFVYKTFDDLVDIHTQTSIVMSDFSELTEDTMFANSHTQTETLQSDFDDSSILSSSVQTDTHWAQMTQLSNGQFRSGSLTSTSCQTYTQDAQTCSVSSSETQT